ncbi:MAG: VWA domain-containing protein [Deltaproteobacteria bacterium]|nr:MAG: VWA domain-containing protein [Deltaproteobacteria bacterium]
MHLQRSAALAAQRSITARQRRGMGARRGQQRRTSWRHALGPSDPARARHATEPHQIRPCRGAVVEPRLLSGCRAWKKCCRRTATMFDQLVKTGRARRASRARGGSMRKRLSTVVLGIGLFSLGCKQAQRVAPAGNVTADRVESKVAREPEAVRVAPAGGAAGSAAMADPAADVAAPTHAVAGAAAPTPPATTPPDDSAASGMATRSARVAAEPALGANVRAGEWDDNANYRDYVRWLKETPHGIARLDVSGRQFLVVEDAAGKPVPNCKITITGGAHSAQLVTMASGRALLFPRALGLDGTTLAAVAACGQATTQATIHTEQVDGVVELKLTTARALPARRTVDLAFVLDTTGSMGEEIDAVKSTIRAVAAKLGAEQTDVRIGLVEYKDRTDPHVTRTYPFSSDLRAFSRSVAELSAAGGGDTPEDMQAGLSAALDGLLWRSDATARLIVVVADAPPHLDYQDERDYADAARRAAARGIKMFTVSASGMDDTGQIVMRQMAQFTGASNLFVLRGGAGPQSIGGGDPKSSCGGTQEQYASGNLDQLIVGKVKRELASLDGDPLKIAGRGKDENAKPCNQRIVMAN